MRVPKYPRVKLRTNDIISDVNQRQKPPQAWYQEQLPPNFSLSAHQWHMGMSSKWIYGTSASSSDPVNIEHTHLSHLPRCAEPIIHTVARLYNEP